MPDSKTGVVFDFNGTLFFDSPLHVIAWDETAQAIGAGHVDAHTMATVYSGLPNAEILKLMKPGMDDAFYSHWSRYKEAAYRDAVLQMPGGAKLAPGAVELFDALKNQKVPFTIASASIIENIRFFVEVFHLDQWMDPNLIVYDDGSYRDKTAMYETAFRRLGVEGAYIFEDALAGLDAASKVAGARIFLIDSPAMRPYVRQYPSCIGAVHDFYEGRKRLETEGLLA